MDPKASDDFYVGQTFSCLTLPARRQGASADKLQVQAAEFPTPCWTCQVQARPSNPQAALDGGQCACASVLSCEVLLAKYALSNALARLLLVARCEFRSHMCHGSRCCRIHRRLYTDFVLFGTVVCQAFPQLCHACTTHGVCQLYARLTSTVSLYCSHWAFWGRAWIRGR